MARRRKNASCRPLKLTEQQAVELRAWYYSPRSVAQKARELGISRSTAYAYIQRMHRQRKEYVADIEALADEVTEQMCTEHSRSVPRNEGDECIADQS